MDMSLNDHLVFPITRSKESSDEGRGPADGPAIDRR
jgi:hypothetical protein